VKIALGVRGGAVMSKHIKLGMFYWPCGHHIAAWRHPDAVADSGAKSRI